MKKLSKKKILCTLMVLFLLIAGIVGVYAATKYYNYSWTNEVSDTYDNQEFVTNNILEYDDGFIAVGFEDYSTPAVRVLSKDGLVRKKVTLSDLLMGELLLKKVIKYENGYRIFGVGPNHLHIIELSSNFKVNNIYDYESNMMGTVDEYWVEEDTNNYYVVSESYLAERVYVVDKATMSGELLLDSLYTDEQYDLLEKYYYVEEYLDDFENDYDIFESSLFVEYNENKTVLGFVYSDESDEIFSRIVYLVDGKEEYVNYEFIKDGIFFNDDKILYSLNKYDDSGDLTKSELILVDTNGKELSKESISNYLESSDNLFIVEHLVSVPGVGFFLNGSEVFSETSDENIIDGKMPLEKDDKVSLPNEDSMEQKLQNGKSDGNEPPAGSPGEMDAKDKFVVPSINITDVGSEDGNVDFYDMTNEVLLFKCSHQVDTQVKGKGTIEVSHTEADWGDEVTFTISPAEGYVLGVVKVTDSNGSVVTFTDYTFVMPNADVTIEVTFVVENPETYAFISVIVFAALGGSFYWFITSRKKKTYIEE